MNKIAGLIRTLGWKHFLWKAWLITKKKLGTEAWFYKSVPYGSELIDGINPGDYIQIGGEIGLLSDKKRADIAGQIKKMELPLREWRQKTADILQGKIPYFSHSNMVFDKLDFNYNPIEKIHLPTGRHSSRFFSFDPRFGDLKKAWELNRFQWANMLVSTYIISDDADEKAKIRNFAEASLMQWLDQCPHGRCVAWACSQEISIRAMNWFWLIWLLEIKNERVLQPCFKALYLSARHVYRQIDFARAQRNNHAVTESVFLIFFSAVAPRLPEAALYRQKGEEVLMECLQDQFFEDGGYIQNSHTYHRFALQSLCVAFPLIETKTLKEVLRQKMEASWHFLRAHVANDAGDFPNLGPNDGAMLYNFGGNDYRDMRPLLNQLTGILYGGSMAFDTEAALVVDALLIGQEGANRTTGSIPEQPVTPRLVFSRSGQAVLQNEDYKVFFRCADLSGRYPSSCDQLQADVWFKGRNILPDTGSWEYYNPAHPDRLVMMLSTKAHNTIRVAGIDQMEKGPRFTFLSKANGKLIYTEDDLSTITGEHDGFSGRAGTKTLHRRTISLRDSVLMISDTITDSDGDVELFWHLPEEDIIWKDQSLFLSAVGIRIDFACNQPFKLLRQSFPRSRYYAEATDSPMACLLVEGTSGIVHLETSVTHI